YDCYGRIKHKFNEGAITECNVNCSCGDDCPNRVVQKGRKLALDLVHHGAGGPGWGVVTPHAIPKKGTFVTMYTGEVISEATAEARGKKYDARNQTYLFSTSDYDQDLATSGDTVLDFSIDANYSGNISRFFNHSCDPNVAAYPVFIH
ncbi:hypothetical protein BDK51DRAFT_6778, partial [Blyttiomyces helicus]